METGTRLVSHSSCVPFSDLSSAAMPTPTRPGPAPIPRHDGTEISRSHPARVILDRCPGDKAIADYNEAIRLDPKDAVAYNNCGNAWRAKKEHDKAIADYNEAIRLDPSIAMTYNNRGLAWNNKKEHDKAIADYNEAIRIDPKLAWAYIGRAVTLFITRREGAIDGTKTALAVEGWRGEVPIYAVVLGHFAAIQAGHGEQAKAFLDDAAAHCDKETWPYPIVKYLRGELDEAKLLAAAVDNDKMTEVHGYLGVDLLQKGQKGPATAHFRWVKEHGNPTFVEYIIALAELDRLEAKPLATHAP